MYEFMFWHSKGSFHDGNFKGIVLRWERRSSNKGITRE